MRRKEIDTIFRQPTILSAEQRDGRTLLEVLRGSVNKLQSNELEATLLEAGDDLADESTLDTVGLQSHRNYVLARYTFFDLAAATDRRHPHRERVDRGGQR